jgi:polysaccharide export outer membrane protein
MKQRSSVRFLTLFFALLLAQPLVSASTDSGNAISDENIIHGTVTETHSTRLAQKCSNHEFTHQDGDYILGPNDTFSISIMGYPEQDADHVRVQPDGNIILQTLDEPLKVEGMTLTQLYCELTTAYSRFIPDPRLTIDMLQTKPYMVYVTGGVLNPGSYEMVTQAAMNPPQSLPEVTVNRTTPMLSNVLVAAGGVSYNADLHHVSVTNKHTGKNRVVDLIALLQQGDNSQDVRLVKDDVVNVPKLNTVINEKDYRVYASSSFSPKTIPVKVYGYVNDPGLVELQKAQSLNLLSAITAAGGYQRDAAYSPSKVFIFRPVDEEGHLVRFDVNPKTNDITLFPNDIVYVPQKKIPRTGLFFDFMARILTPAVRGATTYSVFTGQPLF